MDAINKILAMILFSLYAIGCVSNNTTQNYYHDLQSPLTVERSTPEIPFEQQDLDWLYRTVYGEVRNQGDSEIKAVCHVIYNRLQSGLWGSTFRDVVLAPRQFSVWNYDDPQRPLLMDTIVYSEPQGMPRVKALCNQVLTERLQGVDESKGVNYFYHPGGMKPKCTHHKRIKHHRKPVCTCWKRLPPEWAYNYEHKERVGAGVFFRKTL